MVIEVCSRGHSMQDCIVRGDGRRECRTCYRYRVKSEAGRRANGRRGKDAAPYSTLLRTVPAFAPDDVVVVFSRELAEQIMPGLTVLARGEHTGTGRAAAWMHRAIRAELDSEVAHAGNESVSREAAPR